MGCGYQAIIDLEATPDAAEALGRHVIERLSAEGLVMPSLDPDAVLGGTGGFRPGYRINDLYGLSPGEDEFWTQVTNGLEVQTGPWFNWFSGHFIQNYACPRCNVVFPQDDALADQFYDAGRQFYGGVARPMVLCPRCSAASAVQEWRFSNHLGFVYLAFVFWNWPPFDEPGWKVDVPALISEVVGHKVVVAFGRV
jgi:ribosomal protein S27AE